MISTMFSFLAGLQMTDDNIRETKTMDLEKIIKLDG
tara:strand:+ start:41 stop:148 length:108 start_codon:yes stop_codon:yes gene_type:complete